mmetsp:Transcript_16484/g.41347  ORF Transcript_16484/g.41347 Transcript_16484/m.41347 type:complete len:620 (+) Transcript_16484:182-2041(+)|eukprot:CAMPEP_0116091980 /NCGR_PEP_ID=MMETSP0327-20121206/7793_1 /TAXON_ID=44447 /ORGANISM="Pseudo-nitzschia delicatissima, Strain B596" /LENGTH=619 /DNA_ID=CAMNT_0003583365 /DNA_START=128 /DNA_END=1987 /DNA_ORIENTATION=-
MDEDKPRDTKRRKTNGADNDHSSPICPFSLLDDDSLRAVLLRTRASDQRNLNLSCKRIRRVLNSTLYRKERSVLGWAEVKVELLDPFEQYKRASEFYEEDNPPSRDDKCFKEEYDLLGLVEEYGSHSFREHTNLLVFVDDWPIHKSGSINKERERESFELSVELLPRKTSSFYESCDIHSNDLQNVGTTLFSNNGNPKVGSLKHALKDDDTRLPLLYVAHFKLPRLYRSMSSTVGPLILQELLKTFKDEYSIAIYIPCYHAQLGPEDKAIEYREKVRHLDAEPTDEEILAKKKIEKRICELTNQDMRQFYRAGFRQVDDAIVVNQNLCSFLFLTRKDALESILTQQQALALPVASPPPPPEPKSGLPKQLFDLLKKKCSLYSKHMENLQSMCLERESHIEGENPSPRLLLLFRNYLASKECLGLSSEADDMDELSNSVKEAIEGILSQCEADEDRFGVILDSDSFHVCAANVNLIFIGALIASLPEPQRQIAIALNHLDINGFTPLMICAMKISKKDLNPRVAALSRGFVESILRLGADRSVVHATTGLSALGYFREGRENIRVFSTTFGYRDPQEEVYREEASRIEKVLEPDEGPTVADDAIIYVYDESDEEEEEGDY